MILKRHGLHGFHGSFA